MRQRGEGRQHAGCSKSRSGSGERRGPCPDLWMPAGVIREWIGSFSISPFTALQCLQPISEQPHCCYMMIYILYDLLQYADNLIQCDLQWIYSCHMQVSGSCLVPTDPVLPTVSDDCLLPWRQKQSWLWLWSLERQTGRQTVFKYVHVQRSTY